MALKRTYDDVVADYATGSYNNIADLYNVLIGISDYTMNYLCLDDVFTKPHTSNEATCGTEWAVAINILDHQYTEAQIIESYELFGYEYEIYKGTCDDNGACKCNNRNFNGRNIISKRKYGVLTDNGYLTNDYSREYLMQLNYDESENCIFISDEHSKVNPAFDTSYLTLNPEFYKKKLLMTYVGFDNENAKFLEQIVLDKGHETDGIWRYDLSGADCAHSNIDCVAEGTVDVDIDSMTVIVGYVNDLGFLSETTTTYPVVYTRNISTLNGVTKLDGVYKTYYFQLADLVALMMTNPSTIVLEEGAIYYFEYLDTDGITTITEYRKIKSHVDVNYNTITAVTFTGGMSVYNLSLPDDKRNFILDISEEVSVIDYLKNLGTFKNVINADNSLTIDSYVGEDAHLITYNLRDNIIESI